MVDDRSDEHAFIQFTGDGRPQTITWRRRPPAALSQDRYGAGTGVYLDPAEATAARETASLLFSIRQGATLATEAHRIGDHMGSEPWLRQ